MMERLDSYKGINKTSQHIKRFSDSANSTERKKGKLQRKGSKETVHEDFMKDEGSVETNKVNLSKDTNASTNEMGVALQSSPSPPPPQSPHLGPPPTREEENVTTTHVGQTTHRPSLATDVKIMQKLRKSEKKARKKIAHHISYKLSEVITTQSVLKETIQRNEENIQKILKVLSQRED